ncbi:hypothetical protein LSAT2_005382 [Lamellibrachia satsuma]|nr:hypothetical protein LSAT2_005382 [Lamellibrachia satsuma]
MNRELRDCLGIHHILRESVPQIDRSDRKDSLLSQQSGSRFENLHCVPSDLVNYDKSFLMTYVPYSRVNHVIENIKGGPRPESTYDKRHAAHYFQGGSPVGVLTALGRDQMYMFGRRLRSLYIDKLGLLDKEFNPKQIKIRSSNLSRSIESLESVIAGLYGQHSFDNRDPLVIPVSEESEEFLYPNIHCCPVLQTITKEGQLYLASLEGFQNVVQKISHRLGVQLDPKEVDMVMWRDNIMVRQALGLPVPKTLLEILPEIDYYGTHALEIIVCGPPKESDFLMRLSGMPLGRLIEKNIHNACSDPSSAPKVQLYSVHDSTIVLLLSMLGCFNHHWPPYSADIRLELYEAPACDDRYWMKILYCNKAVVMPGFNSEEYPYICTTKFYDLLRRYKVTSKAEYVRMKGCNMYNL